jgi:hypothetical protein
MRNAVGFYWTRPVNWADFKFLPKDVEAAAERSKTIRYQREVVRQWTADNAYRLVYEIAYIDTRTDRATDGCKTALDLAHQKCTDPKAALVYVNFAGRLWRQNPHIHDHAKTLGFEPIDLSPKPIAIDGKLFDPIEHFEAWRDLDKTTKADLRRAADEGLLEAYLQFNEDEGRYAQMAKWLNGQGIKTVTGKVWDTDLVRKAIKAKIETDESALPGIFD